MVRPADGPPQPFAIPADGIALSADGATLYYCPLSSRHLFSVPTAYLRDRSVPEEQVGAAVADLPGIRDRCSTRLSRVAVSSAMSICISTGTVSSLSQGFSFEAPLDSSRSLAA